SYYLLGYHSTNTEADGRFRRITVRVQRPGVRVRARRGYRAATHEAVRAEARERQQTQAALAVASAINVVAGVDPRAEFRLRTSSWGDAPGAGGIGTFWIVGELDFRTRRELAWTAGATAEVSV